ncbi:unnamed protein product, partial [Timema podura]|nr:unnamed protein product [Timema podura]
MDTRKSRSSCCLPRESKVEVKVKLLLTKGEQGEVKVKLLITEGEQVKVKKELFASKVESTSESGRERKMSSSSTGSMKNKWLKAFKSLKTGSGTTPTNGAPREADKYRTIRGYVLSKVPYYLRFRIIRGSVLSELPYYTRSHTVQGSVLSKIPYYPRKNGKETGALQAANADPSVHAFQEYTYKKITPCDVCSQVLRGHARQGLKCR